MAVIYQVVGVAVILIVLFGGGYYWRSAQLATVQAAHAASPTPLGDLSTFRQITQDTLTLARAGNLAEAKTRVKDLETAWDDAQANLKPMNPDKWMLMDGDIDNVLQNLRASQPDATSCSRALQTLLNVINTLDPQKTS